MAEGLVVLAPGPGPARDLALARGVDLATAVETNPGAPLDPRAAASLAASRRGAKRRATTNRAAVPARDPALARAPTNVGRKTGIESAPPGLPRRPTRRSPNRGPNLAPNPDPAPCQLLPINTWNNNACVKGGELKDFFFQSVPDIFLLATCSFLYFFLLTNVVLFP